MSNTMQGLWCWLGANATQLQTVFSILGVLVAIALAYVAIRQARAADAQARAANRQVEAANRQIAASILIADTQTSPNVAISQTTHQGAIVRNSLQMFNNGNGAAKGLQLQYRDHSVGFDIPLLNTVLVPRDGLSFVFDEVRGAKSGFRLIYVTSFGARYALEFDWNGQISRVINERLLMLSPPTAVDAEEGLSS